MKFALATVIALLSIFSSAQAQLKDEQLTPLFSVLAEKNWSEAHKMANDILLKHDTEQSSPAAYVRYIALYTGAAMVAEGKLTYEQFTPYAQQFIGKVMVMAAHPTVVDSANTLALNATVLKPANGQLTAYVACTSDKKDQIYSYELFKFGPKYEHAKYDGRTTRTAGVLEAVVLNPDKKTDWIMQLTFDKAQLYLLKADGTN